MFTIACCLVEGLGLRLGLVLSSDWSVVIHKHLYYLPLSLYRSLMERAIIILLKAESELYGPRVMAHLQSTA